MATKALMNKVAIILGIGVCALVAFPLLRGAPQSAAIKLPDAPLPHAELQAFLDEYRRSWLPDRRRALVKTAVERREDFAAGLAYVMGERDHPARDVAMTLTAELDLRQHRDLVRKIALGALYRLRPQAILVADGLGAWSDAESASFLTSKDAKVVIAGLALPNPKPWRRLLELLDRKESAIVQACLRSLPVELSPDQRSDLLAAASTGRDGKRLAAMRAISRYEIDGTTESALSGIALAAPEALRRQALVTLSKKVGHLQDPQQVYWIVVNSMAQIETKALALYCLEKTDSFDAQALVRDVRVMPALLRYHAARCLIRRNNRRGVDLLVELLVEAKTGGSDISSDLVSATRQLLGQLSGRGIGAPRDDWIRSIQRMDDLSLATLPEPSLFDVVSPL